jgi:hypothetical protein
MIDKKVLIVFSDYYLPYSPSTLNLFYELKKNKFDVRILAAQPNPDFSLQKIVDEKIEYVTPVRNDRNVVGRVYDKVVSKVISKEQLDRKNLMSGLAISFIKKIGDIEADEIIAVDFFSLWCVQQAGKTAHLLSLEIQEFDPYFNNCNLSKIKSVLIQTEKRFNHLFRNSVKPPFSILPNSPPLIDFKPDVQGREKFNLVYCGSAIIEFGIFSCLDFISDFPEYKLTIKGAVPSNTREGIEKYYSELLTSKRLVINDTYMDATGLTQFISKFWAGFAFYDFYRFPHLRRFNYYTAPSGKLYQYFNSGVPVVGNMLEGFTMVDNYNAGKLISYLSANQIKNALDYIENDYNEISENSKKLSFHFDSASFLQKFIKEFLISN